MNSLLLLSLLACNKDGEPLDSGIAGELVTFTITVENVGVAYPYIDAALPGDDAVDVPVDSELTLIAVTDEGDVLASAPVTCWDESRAAIAPGAVELKELRVVEGLIQLRAAKSSAQVNSQAEGVGFSISGGETLQLYGIAHHIGDGAALDGSEPAAWLQSLVAGDVAAAESALEALVGVTHVAGAGYAASSLEPSVLWIDGEPDEGMGMEALAEDGDPLPILASAAERVHDGSVFADQEGGGYEPLLPGSQTTFTLEASTGEVLHFATMLAQSNDLFIGHGDGGVPLFEDDGTPISGEIQDQLLLWNLGTEVDQPLGKGPDQAPRQASGNSGAADDESAVRKVEDDQAPSPAQVIRVTVVPSE
ncbi:MAG: spondin domain-containing protein [Myxococcota bacterium]|nr:spondin domain-containing protein [Myxococcota bacterium]